MTYGQTATNGHWKITWNSGTTEGGSSGSPLVNNSHRVIGQLHGGYSACVDHPSGLGPNKHDWYGKFSVSWTGNGSLDNRRKLQPWLDPLNTHQTLDGKDSKPFISGPDVLCLNTNGTYTLTGTPSGITSVNWSSSQGITLPTRVSIIPMSVIAHNTTTMPLIQPTSSFPFMNIGISSGTISATVTINGVSSVLTKTVVIGYPSGTIIGPTTTMYAGYYTFRADFDVPSNASVRWVAVSRSNPNVTPTLYTGHFANIRLYDGLNDIYMQYEDNCFRSNPTTMFVNVGRQVLSDSTDATTALNVQLSPNPVTNSLNVMVEDATDPIEVTVYSSSGIVYLSQTFTTPTFTMDLSPCQPGMLVVRISSGNKYAVKNILKQ